MISAVERRFKSPGSMNNLYRNPRLADSSNLLCVIRVADEVILFSFFNSIF